MYVCLQPTYERNSCEARITGIRGPQALALAPYVHISKVWAYLARILRLEL